MPVLRRRGPQRSENTRRRSARSAGLDVRAIRGVAGCRRPERPDLDTDPGTAYSAAKSDWEGFDV